MRFKKYINEGVTENIIEIIKRDCKPFLSDWKKLHVTRFLYSGRKDTIRFEKKSIRKDRIPTDTPLPLHNAIDDWFFKKFGVRSRSNALFATFDHQSAVSYGNVYCIFPIGAYTVISSHKYYDLYNVIRKFKFDQDIVKNPDYVKNNKIIDPIFNELIDDMLKDGDYKKGLVYHTNEQMITCKHYYMVRENISGFDYSDFIN